MCTGGGGSIIVLVASINVLVASINVYRSCAGEKRGLNSRI